MEKKAHERKMDTRKRRRPKREGPTRPGRVDPPIWSLGHLLAFGFDVPLDIYEKVAALGGESYSRNRAPSHPRSSFSETD